MPTRRRLVLEAPQRQELTQYRDDDPRPYVRERCAALLKIADGHTPHAIARTGLLKPRDPDTVYAWLSNYQRGGVAALLERQHGGARRRVL